MTTYNLTPVGARGRIEGRTAEVEGPDLERPPTRLDLLARLVEQGLELERLCRQVAVAQAAARHMEELRLRMDNEAALRVRVKQRLDRVALVFAELADSHPELAGSIEAARKEIWRDGDV